MIRLKENKEFEDFFKTDLYINFTDKLIKALTDKFKHITFKLGKKVGDPLNPLILFDFTSDLFSGSLDPIITQWTFNEAKKVYVDLGFNVSEINRNKLDKKELHIINVIENTVKEEFQLIEANMGEIFYSSFDKGTRVELTRKGILKIYKSGENKFLQYNAEQESIQLKPLNSLRNSLAFPLYIIRKNNVKLNAGNDLSKLRKADSFHFTININKKEDLISDKFIDSILTEFEYYINYFFDINKKYINNLYKEHIKNINIIKDYVLTSLDVIEQNIQNI